MNKRNSELENSIIRQTDPTNESMEIPPPPTIVNSVEEIKYTQQPVIQ